MNGHTYIHIIHVSSVYQSLPVVGDTDGCRKEEQSISGKSQSSRWSRWPQWDQRLIIQYYTHDRHYQNRAFLRAARARFSVC